MRLLLQDNRGPEVAVATGIAYTLSPPHLCPLFIARSNNLTSITWAGPGTLQYSASLPATWTNLTNVVSPYTFQAASGRQFFRLAE